MAIAIIPQVDDWFDDVLEYRIETIFHHNRNQEGCCSSSRTIEVQTQNENKMY